MQFLNFCQLFYLVNQLNKIPFIGKWPLKFYLRVHFLSGERACEVIQEEGGGSFNFFG